MAGGPSRARRKSPSSAKVPTPPPPPRILILLPLLLFAACISLLRHHRHESHLRLQEQASSYLGQRSREHATAAELSTLYRRSYAALDDPSSAEPDSWPFATASHSPHAHPAARPNATHDVPSYIPYHNLYVELPPALGIALLVLWLLFLFSFLGIVASDFFCPNLSTLASRLGLPEDVAGATMVGWANGAPDLFSTFASLKAGSGSLAIGELIGAASFICSIVAGSMVLVKPFKVQRFNFFRDVGFFTLAVAFSIIILRDGRIHAWEANTMIALYFCYVALVAVGSWYRRRRWRQKERERLIRGAWTENEDNQSDGDEDGECHSSVRDRQSRRSLDPLIIPEVTIARPPSSPLLERQESAESPDDYFGSRRPASSRRSSGARSPGRAPLHTSSSTASGLHTPTGSGRKRSTTLSAAAAGGHGTPRHHSHPHSHMRSASHHAIHLQGRMSFLGAVEFRDVVNSLQAEGGASKRLAPFESPALATRPRGKSGSNSGAATPVYARDEEESTALGLGMARSPSRASQPGSRGGRPQSFHGRRTKKQSSGSSRDSAGAGLGENARNPSDRTSKPIKGRMRSISNPNSSPSALGNWPDQGSVPPAGVLAVPAMPGFEDPWKGSACDVHDAPDTLADIPTWSWPASTPASATKSLQPPSDDSVSARNEDSSPGESDITARPPASQSAAAVPQALAKYPTKALKVLGVQQDDAGSVQPSVPSKAQRVLGVTGEATSDSNVRPPSSARYNLRRVAAIVRALLYSLFPSMHNFTSKSFLAMITSLVSVPAVLLLNLTLPVVDESGAEDDEDEEYMREALEKDRLESELDGQIKLPDSDDPPNGEAGDIHYNHHGPLAAHFLRGVTDSDEDSEIEEELDEMEEEERARNVRRSLAIAHELHSPVATHHHHHQHTAHGSHLAPGDPTHLTVSPVVATPLEGSAQAEDSEPAAPYTLPPVNDITVGAAALPALQQHANSHRDGRLLENADGGDGEDANPSGCCTPLHDAEQYGVDELQLTRYITAIQCLLAPMFAVLALFGERNGPECLPPYFLPLTPSLQATNCTSGMSAPRLASASHCRPLHCCSSRTRPTSRECFRSALSAFLWRSSGS